MKMENVVNQWNIPQCTQCDTEQARGNELEKTNETTVRKMTVYKCPNCGAKHTLRKYEAYDIRPLIGEIE
jgi:predicted RNA-binding Zn-ribbon protein involved in translation (DUF1610 family)